MPAMREIIFPSRVNSRTDYFNVDIIDLKTLDFGLGIGCGTSLLRLELVILSFRADCFHKNTSQQPCVQLYNGLWILEFDRPHESIS